MRSETLSAMFFLMVAFAASAFAEQKDAFTTLMDVKVPSLEITKPNRSDFGHNICAGSTSDVVNRR